MADELAVADPAPQIAAENTPVLPPDLNDLMMQEMDTVVGRQEPTQSVEHDPQGSTPADALSPDADDVPIYENDPHSVRERVNKLNTKFAAAEQARVAEAARAEAAETRLRELEASFADQVTPEMAALGYTSRAAFAADVAAQLQRDAQAKANADAQKLRDELYAKHGEEYGEMLFRSDQLARQTQTKLEQVQREAQEFRDAQLRQTAITQSQQLISATLETLPAVTHKRVSALLSTVPAAQLPAIVAEMKELILETANDARSTYASTKEADRDRTSPTPEGDGGRSPATTGAADWRAVKQDIEAGGKSLSDFF